MGQSADPTKATLVFLTGFPSGLDDRGLKKCEHTLATPLPSNINPPEVPAGWTVRHNNSFALLGAAFRSPNFCLRQLQEKLNRAERLMVTVGTKDG